MTDTTQSRYDPTTIALHWATATLVVLLWLIGQTADWLPRGPVRGAAWSVHVVLGFVLAVVVVWRVVWRGGAGRALPAADPGALHILAKATHYLLYGLLLTVVGLGLVNAVVRGFSIFGLFSLPQVGDPGWRRPLTEWHGLAANILLALAAFHAAAALVHHYVWRDGVLRRMAPARSGAGIGDDRPAET